MEAGLLAMCALRLAYDRVDAIAGKPAPTGPQGCYLNAAHAFSTRILAEISSTEKCVWS